MNADPAGIERAAAAQALAEGFVLGSYQFLKYKGNGDATRLSKVVVVGRANARVEAALDRGATVSAAVTWARDMVNEPSGAKSPMAFADAAKKLLRGKGVTVKVMTEAELKAQGLGGVVGVGQGSGNPPRLVKATYSPVIGLALKATSGTARRTRALPPTGVTPLCQLGRAM